METSESTKEISKALKEWHELQTTITKDSTNPHFKSKFASLDTIIEHIRVPLASRGLAFTQFPDGDGLTTLLTHTSGEWIKATANLHLDKNTPQGQGSAITYMRRYALSAALGLATEEDDDGNEASKAPVAAKKAPLRDETKKDDPILAKKNRIADLMEKVKGKRLKGDELRMAIVEETDLEPTDNNLEDIITRLETVLGI